MEYDNIYMNRGDTLDFKFDVIGAEADLSSAFFSCKKDPNDDEYIFQKSLGDGIVKVSTAEDGTRTYSVTVDPSDTVDLEYKTYYYDLQIAFSESQVYTPFKGLLKIDWDITRTEEEGGVINGRKF